MVFSQTRKTFIKLFLYLSTVLKSLIMTQLTFLFYWNNIFFLGCFFHQFFERWCEINWLEITATKKWNKLNVRFTSNIYIFQPKLIFIYHKILLLCSWEFFFFLLSFKFFEFFILKFINYILPSLIFLFKFLFITWFHSF